MVDLNRSLSLAINSSVSLAFGSNLLLATIFHKTLIIGVLKVVLINIFFPDDSKRSFIKKFASSVTKGLSTHFTSPTCFNSFLYLE